MDKDMKYGTSREPKVSFAYGSLAQAYADSTPGSINFGYDQETGVGGIYLNGTLMSASVYKMQLTDSETEGMHNVEVFFINDHGSVESMTFQTVDEELISTLSQQKTIYVSGDYINVDDNENTISVDFNSLYEALKERLAGEGIGDQDEINRYQSEHIAAIEAAYVKSVSKEETEDNVTIEVTQSAKSGELTPVVSTVQFSVPKNTASQSEVNAMKSALDASINDLSADVDAMESQVDGLENEIGIIDSSISYIENDINEIKNTVGGDWVDISDLPVS